MSRTQKSPQNTTDACPCGSSSSYTHCCARYHRGPLALGAPTAEALMRSRYTAYVLDLRPYLLATWHPSTRPAQMDPPESGLRWLGLQVLEHHQIDENHATVEFVARSKLAGRAWRMHERSRFERIEGLWFYVDGAG